MNWAEHFRTVSARRVEFGTFLGNYTVADLVDLLAAKDNELSQVDAHFRAQPPDEALAADWQALKSRYQAARARAQAAVDANKVSPVPATVQSAQDEYVGILRSLTVTEGTVQRGDMQDIYNRSPFLEGPIPQPKSADVDLEAFKVTDQATRDVPGFVKRGIATFAPGLVPKTRDSASYKPLSRWEKALFVGGAVIVGALGLRVAVKVVL